MPKMTNEQYWNSRKQRYPFYVTMLPESAPAPEKIARALGEFIRIPMNDEGRKVVNWGFVSEQDAELFVSKFAKTGVVRKHP